jgi:hypothetical protein
MIDQYSARSPGASLQRLMQISGERALTAVVKNPTLGIRNRLLETAGLAMPHPSRRKRGSSSRAYPDCGETSIIEFGAMVQCSAT